MLDGNLSFNNNRIWFSHCSYDTVPKTGFHLHNGCELYLLIDGNVNYFIENKIYPVNTKNLIITNSDELHMVSFLSQKHYERYCLVFNPSVATEFSTMETSLLTCFINRNKGENNIISMTSEELANILRILKRMEYLGTSKPFGFDVLFYAAFIELLVTVNQIFNSFCPSDTHKPLPARLSSVFQYINANLNGDLSLDNLGSIFYINKHYLRKLFKSHTGFNLSEYVLYQRISKAKTLLKDGLSLNDTMEACGFNDYCNFIRNFKKITGVPPGRYKRYS